MASEVIEHVDDPRAFGATLAQLAAPGGGVLITTFNRTPLSYFIGIVMAERVTRLVPTGTHEWNKFVKPEEMILVM